MELSNSNSVFAQRAKTRTRTSWGRLGFSFLCVAMVCAAQASSEGNSGGNSAEPADEKREGWETFHDKEFGYKLDHPSGPGWLCGRGAYGSGYDEQFGCKGDPFKLLVIARTVNSQNRFDLNVRTSFIRGSRKQILEMIAESMPDHDYKSLGSLKEGDVRMAGFESARYRREIWYVLHEGLLLEVNFKFGSKYKEGKPHAEAKETLQEIVNSIKFVEIEEGAEEVKEVHGTE